MPYFSYDSIVATIALLVALIALAKSFSFDRSKIAITYATYTLRVDRPIKIEIGIMNNSTNSITIRDIQYIDANGKQLKPIEYSPPQVLYLVSSHDVASPLEADDILGPFEKTYSRFYVRSLASPVTITIRADKPIHYLFKKKSFTVKFKQEN